MENYESPSHSKWERKYNVVLIPKCRRKTLCGTVSALYTERRSGTL
jgi:REP element-mobilizing transposase RayT